MANLDFFKRDVLVSIRPYYAEKIIGGQKTVELRRRFPEEAATGGLALIYSSSPVRAIIGYARIKDVRRLPVEQIWQEHGADACISRDDFDRYFDGLGYGFAILLAEVRKLTKQVGASDLQERFGFVAAQSFRYVGEEYHSLLKDERVQTSRRHERRHSA